MALKAQYDSMDSVPDGLRDHYEERDGKAVLTIEGTLPGLRPAGELAESKQKLDEFRDNNRALKAKLDEAQARLESYDGVDPGEYKELKQRVSEFEKKGAKKPDDIEAQIKAAVSANVKPLQDQIASLSEERKRAQQELREQRLESTLTEQGLAAGIDDKALPDYLSRAKQQFTLDDEGRVVAKDENGVTIRSPETADPLTPKEWASTQLADQAPHLFRPSKGGGASGGPGTTPSTKTISLEDFAKGKGIEDVAAGKAVVQQ